MKGLAILDTRARFLWKSWEFPAVAGRTKGRKVWHWMDVEGKAAFKRALADVAFDGAKSVQLKVEAGVDDDRHVFDCTLQQLPCGLFVVSYTRTPARTVKLSPRELQIVHAECQDEPMKVTAKRLNVSLKTIEAHRANVRRKTETTGPATLTRWAIEHGHVAH